MTQELKLRRKWTFRAHGKQVVFIKKAFESDIHIIGRQDSVFRHTSHSHITHEFNLLSKFWSSGPGQSQMALPKSKAVGYWNIGILEYWVWRIEIYFCMDDTD